MKRQFSISVLLLTLAGPALAVEGPTVELGRVLFSSTTLGSNGKSCASCHTAGKGLEEITAYDDTELREIVNFCIRDALGGRMLSPDSQELDSLLLYLRAQTKN